SFSENRKGNHHVADRDALLDLWHFLPKGEPGHENQSGGRTPHDGVENASRHLAISAAIIASERLRSVRAVTSTSWPAFLQNDVPNSGDGECNRHRLTTMPT